MSWAYNHCRLDKLMALLAPLHGFLYPSSTSCGIAVICIERWSLFSLFFESELNSWAALANRMQDNGQHTSSNFGLPEVFHPVILSLSQKPQPCMLGLAHWRRRGHWSCLGGLLKQLAAPSPQHMRASQDQQSSLCHWQHRSLLPAAGGFQYFDD